MVSVRRVAAAALGLLLHPPAFAQVTTAEARIFTAQRQFLYALDAATGRRVWHVQAVHHDIWDREFPSPPSLVTVTRNRRRVDAAAQATKQASESGGIYVAFAVPKDPTFK